MTKMTDEKLLEIVNSEFDGAMGAPSGEIAEERAKAWEYYQSEKRGDEVEGDSQVVTSDVADVVGGLMPSLMRMFTTQDNLVSFDAVGQEDEPGAEQESDFVSYVFFKRNPAFLLLFYWFFDALLQKNGIVKAWWDDSEVVTREAYKDLTEEEMIELMGDDELEVVERSEREISMIDPASGMEVPFKLHDIIFTRTTESGYARVENVPPEEYRISSDSRSLDPSAARMVGHERLVTRSELIAMGFDKEIVDELEPEKAAAVTPEALARKSKTDDHQDVSDDKSMEQVLFRQAHIKVDYNGDGIAELRHVSSVGKKILENEEADRQPFHVLCGSPLPHKHFGDAYAMKAAKDVQEVSTTLLRQTLMNLYHTNNPGHAVWEQGMGDNTMSDLLTTRVGGVKRFSRPVNESYAPLTVPFTAGASFPMLEYWDKVKRDRSGISADGEGLSPEALKNIQQSVMASSVDISKMKQELVARIFAETGIKTLFLHIHELLQKHQQKDEIVKLRGQYVKVSPQAWRTRKDMTVNIGLGIGTRENNLMHLESIWNKQSAMVAGGGKNLTVSPKNVFNTAAEIVKNANLKLPGMFFTDPGDEAKFPEGSDEQVELQKQQQALEQRRQQLDAERQQIKQQELQLKAEKQQFEAQKAMADMQAKLDKQENEFTIDNEKLRNQLTDLQLRNSSLEADRAIVAARTAQEIAESRARTIKIHADTARTLEDTEGQAIENAAAESGVTKLLEDLNGESEAT